MKNINKRQFIILCTLPIICISMFLLIPLLTNKIGKTGGYIGGFWIYWFVFCLPASLYSCNGLSGLKGVYSQRSNIKTSEKLIWYVIALMPCIATFFMGLLWGWVAYKTKSIKFVTVAHIITNFSAFTGLIFENWFI